jgi:invasion protein IalB
MANRCQAVANLAPDFQESLSRAEKASATIMLQNGKSVNLPLSVKGLADGLAALKAPAPPG